MAERTTKVRISAQISEYVAGMEKAAQVTRETGTAAEKLGQKKEAFQTLGAGAAVVGGAMTALTVAVAKTGIEYNTLQQTSRAALSTLLGGAEAANAQMDKLDEFARTSPFSKAVFITAQQQMLGFGVAAENVVPTLDAIQNAVAAMGGGNEQISALAEIMSRIKSESRLSGDALQRMGYYGIDAATIIGSEVGKTAVEIREMASKPGGIPVDQIWNPLVDGLQEKFGGAADNVKETFAGALDRVSAAWRDLSADLVTPLVDPNGGGGLVDFLNQVADVTRGIQALPEPVKIAGGAIFALTGLTALAGGAFIAAVPKVAAYNAAIATMGGNAQRASRLIGTLAKGAGVAAGFLALTKGAEMAAHAMGQMGDGAKTANETLSLLQKGEYDDIFDGIVPSIDGLNDALDVLHSNDPSAAFNRWGSDVFAWTGLTSNVGEARKQFALMGDELAGMVNSGDSDRAADLFDEIRVKAEAQGYSVEQLNEIMPQYQDALLGVENDALAAAGSTDVATAAFDEQANAAEAAEDALDAMREALDNVGGSAMAMGEAKDAALGAINAMRDAAEAEGVALDGVDDASIKYRDSLRDVETASKESAAAIVNDGGSIEDAQKAWQDGRDAIIGMLEAKGMDQAEAIIWAEENLGAAEQVRGGIEDMYRAWLDMEDNAHIKLAVETAEAEQALADLRAMLDGIPNVTYKSVQLDSFTVGNFDVTSNAAGGLYQNKVKAFSAGGFEPGIYPYTPGGIHKFAEEAPEGYVSMDPARRGKSEGVWNAIGNRMGFSEQGSSSVAPAPVSIVVQSKGGINLLDYIDVRIDDSNDGLGSGLRGI